MILLYTVLLFLLGTITLVIKLRARALERRYTRLAVAVDQLVRQPEMKPGNSNRQDPCASAKRAYLLGQLVQKRDRVETRHFAWQRWAERLTRWIGVLREWKGKKLPYTLGALDVWLVLGLIDYLGVGQVQAISTRYVIDTVVSMFGK